MFEVDWQQLLTPSRPLLETVVRGTVVYLVLFAVLRILPRRTVGGVAASDILIIVLIADAVQNGMAGQYESITEGLVLAGTLLFWSNLIDWLDFRFPRLKIASAGPIEIIRDGRFVRENMARESVSEEEVRSHLRQHGIDSEAAVRSACVEGDGQVSVILPGGLPSQPPRRADPR